MSSTFNAKMEALKDCARAVRAGQAEVCELTQAAKGLMACSEYSASASAQRLIDAARDLVKAKTKPKANQIPAKAIVLSYGPPTKRNTDTAVAATFRFSSWSGKDGVNFYTFFSVRDMQYYIQVYEQGEGKYVFIHGNWYVQAKTGPTVADLFKKVQRKEKPAADPFDPFAKGDAADPFDPFASLSASAEGGARAMSGGGGDGSAAEKPTLPKSDAAKHRSFAFLRKAIGAAFDCDDFDLAQSLEA